MHIDGPYSTSCEDGCDCVQPELEITHFKVKTRRKCSNHVSEDPRFQPTYRTITIVALRGGHTIAGRLIFRCREGMHAALYVCCHAGARLELELTAGTER